MHRKVSAKIEVTLDEEHLSSYVENITKSDLIYYAKEDLFEIITNIVKNTEHFEDWVKIEIKNRV